MSRLNPPTSADDPFFSITSVKHRHLAWSLLGPSLIDTDWAPAEQPWLPELSNLINTPIPTEARSARLGLVFEHLWHHWLETTRWRWQANIQVQESGKTLGEMDLIVAPGNTAPLHLELALKFYAGFGTDWIGPNRRDYLRDKLHHTQTRQLSLSGSAAARKHLIEHGWNPDVGQSQAIMRGCLFYPANPDIRVELPDGISDQHWRGNWCHHSELKERLPAGNWYLIAKDEWISPVLSQIAVPNDELYPLLALHFRYLSTPVCLAQMASGRYGWGEIERWFVMPDHWPSKPVSTTSL